jgi:hypothetical protein
MGKVAFSDKLGVGVTAKTDFRRFPPIWLWGKALNTPVSAFLQECQSYFEEKPGIIRNHRLGGKRGYQ